MSAILGFGSNVFDISATYNDFVEYRPTDVTLNIWNYEPIYAARWSEPTEIAHAPQGFVAILPFQQGSNKPIEEQIGPAPNQNISTIEVENNDTPETPGSNVPEPGYGLVIALLLVVLWLRLGKRRLPVGMGLK
jgi:hypothetical protein